MQHNAIAADGRGPLQRDGSIIRVERGKRVANHFSNHDGLFYGKNADVAMVDIRLILNENIVALLEHRGHGGIGNLGNIRSALGRGFF